MVTSPNPARSRMREAAGSCAGGFGLAFVLAVALTDFARTGALVTPAPATGTDLFTCSLFTCVADADAGSDFAPAGSPAPDRAHARASTTMAMPNGDFGNRRAIADTIDLPAAPAPDGGGRSGDAGSGELLHSAEA